MIAARRSSRTAVATRQQEANLFSSAPGTPAARQAGLAAVSLQNSHFTADFRGVFQASRGGKKKGARSILEECVCRSVLTITYVHTHRPAKPRVGLWEGLQLTWYFG